MVVAVALALIDKLRVVPRQKDNGMLRFYIFSMLLFVNFSVALLFPHHSSIAGHGSGHGAVL